MRCAAPVIRAARGMVAGMPDIGPPWSRASPQSSGPWAAQLVRGGCDMLDNDLVTGIRRTRPILLLALLLVGYIATTVPGAKLTMLPDTSHFAFPQHPALFNATELR